MLWLRHSVIGQYKVGLKQFLRSIFTLRSIYVATSNLTKNDLEGEGGLQNAF